MTTGNCVETNVAFEMLEMHRFPEHGSVLNECVLRELLTTV